MLLLGCFVITAVCQASAPAGVIRLENPALSVGIDAADGTIVSVRNQRAGLELITLLSADRQPWLLLLDGNEFVSRSRQFQAVRREAPGRQAVDLQWTTDYGITVRMTLTLADDADQLEMRCVARNGGNRTIIALNCPRLSGIGPLGVAGAANRLLHPAVGGALVRDPFQLFHAGSSIPQGRGFLPSRYPNAFAGASLQMTAYYVDGIGGFYLAAEDAQSTDKDFNFFKTGPAEQLAWEIAHFQWDARPGNDLSLDYPVVLAALTEGSWYEAAQRYRTWAIAQPWCARGTRWERVQRGDASRWLLEEIGAISMWWPFELDIRESVRRTRDAFGARLLHFPLRWTDAASVREARAAGDRLGPFYFPFVALEDGPTYAHQPGDLLFPRTSAVVPKWVAMCPVQPGWRQVATESAEDLAGSGPLRHHNVWIDANPHGCTADSFFFDVGPCAGVPSGITSAYVSLIQDMQAAASRTRGDYVPVGTECVAEPYVSCLDTAYVRTAGIDLFMETMPYTRFLTWIPDGQMEVVPLFEFVYHEYGPVAMQGIYSVNAWTAPQGDDLWSWSEARATLWGQLVVAHFLPPGVEVSAARRAFLQSMTAARTGFARDFLVYGRLQPPPPIDAGTMEIDHGLAPDGWLRKIALAVPDPATQVPPKDGNWNTAQWVASMQTIPSTPAQTSTLTVPVVLAQAYTFQRKLGILLVNLCRDRTVTVPVPIRPSEYGLVDGGYRIDQVTAEGVRRIAGGVGAITVSLDLPPREFVLLRAEAEPGR
ncbi:MAG: YidC/Oxa1 family insertase periplasmic domain-containing protein [Pirellulaceae bacterium]|nr:YidC/Oxa1 family insertase periplasmic domain-containing protein [Pirellulaceae bacterium]